MAAVEPEREYDEEEVEAILERALARQGERKLGLTREELAQIAKEVGIDPGAVHEAVEELEGEREQEESARAVRRRREKRRSRERVGFVRALLSSLALGAGLFAVDYFTGPGWWAHWALLGFGVLLLLRGVRLLIPRTEEEEEALDRREREREERLSQAREAREARKQRRLAKKRAREEKRRAERRRAQAKQRQRRERSEAAEQFERAVESGVSALLRAAAQKLEEAAQPKETPTNTDFGRFVAAQKRRERGEPEPPPRSRREESSPAASEEARPPKVRVAPAPERRGPEGEGLDEEELEEEASSPRARRRR